MRPLERRPSRHRPSRRFRPLLALRRRPRLRWVVVAALAGLAAASVHALASAAEAERDRWGSAREVAVAVRDLPAGLAVAPGDVERRLLPDALVPRGAGPVDPVGQVLTADVYAGEPLVSARLAPSGLSGPAALLPAGTRGIAVPADPSVLPPLQVGDSVDVLTATDPFGDLARAPLVAARRAPVIDVADHAVTVAVPEADAPAIALAATTGLAAIALAGP